MKEQGKVVTERVELRMKKCSAFLPPSTLTHHPSTPRPTQLYIPPTHDQAFHLN